MQSRACVESGLTLLVWWGLWSFCDTYLLEYSPWSELAVLGFCLAVWLVMRWVRLGRRRQGRLGHGSAALIQKDVSLAQEPAESSSLKSESNGADRV